MSVILDILEQEGSLGFEGFTEVYVIGSVLQDAQPSDIDLVLIYDSEMTLATINSARSKVVDTLLRRFEGLVTIHLTVLSEEELAETELLGQVRHHRISGGKAHL